LAPVLVKKFPIKHVMVVGLAIFIVASVIPAWCENFYLVLFFRALSGIGCGMVLPLQATFLAAYPEKERATLMGLSATVGCIVAALVVSVSGVIAAMNWRYVFYLYLINVVALILAVIFIPRNIEMAEQPAETTEQASDEAASGMGGYGKVLFLYYFLLVGSYLFISVLTAELAPYLENVKMGGSAESGLLMSVSMMGSVVAGLILEKYTSILKSMAMPVVFAGSVIAFAMLWLAPNIIVVGVAVFLVGVFASLVAMVVNYELSRELPIAVFTTAAAGTNFFIFVLSFAAPTVCIALLGMVGGSFRSVFMVYTIIQVVMLAFAMVLPKILLNRK
ncbi:MAG: MFS transporter, partial [Peptococcaceae bacterium]|nr:MFS transporter [Peptococcaceae bacterium]